MVYDAEMIWQFVLQFAATFMMAHCMAEDVVSSESEMTVQVQSGSARGPVFEPKLASDVSDTNSSVVLGAVLTPTQNQVPFDELAWVVMIFEFTSFDHSEPLCFGTLFTAADVLTTCHCATSNGATSYLMVKPKSSIVEWDDNYRLVIQTLVHPLCESCKHTTSYNDVAILTIEAMVIMQGLAQEFPRSLIVSDEGLTWEQMYRDCFILDLSTGFNTPRLGTLEVEKRNFTVWRTAIAQNELKSVPIFGSSIAETDHILHTTRFPGSPLMCRRKGGYIPIGIYQGVFCPQWHEPVTPEFVNKSCSNVTLKDCEDCMPVLIEPNLRVVACLNTTHYEMVLKLESLYSWIDDNIFAPFKFTEVLKFHSSRSSIIPRFSSKDLMYTVFLIVAF